jgi:hypothetical protein
MTERNVAPPLSAAKTRTPPGAAAPHTRAYFAGLVAAMLASLAALFISPRDTPPPDDPKALAAWFANHPADWVAAANLTESALDIGVPASVDTWRRAHEHAEMLAPLRPNARAAFVRAGFFHWEELSDADKRAVLAEAVPILRDPQTFYVMAPAIWKLTHDFAYLRNAAGGEYESIARLRDIAANNGRFDDYRSLRDETMKRREEQLATNADGIDPIGFVRIDCNMSDAPLIERVLADLHEHLLDKHPSNTVAVDRLIDFAIRHHLQPLDGLEFAVRDASSASPAQRARLAIALGDIKRANLIETGSAEPSPAWTDYFDERAAYERAHGDAAQANAYALRASANRAKAPVWSGRCANDDICTSAQREIVTDTPRVYTITLARTAGDDVPPYAEVYVDDERIGEAPIAGEATFTSAVLAPGAHRVSVRVVNPFTRSLGQRRVRILRELL